MWGGSKWAGEWPWGPPWWSCPPDRQDLPAHKLCELPGNVRLPCKQAWRGRDPGGGQVQIRLAPFDMQDHHAEFKSDSFPRVKVSYECKLSQRRWVSLAVLCYTYSHTKPSGLDFSYCAAPTASLSSCPCQLECPWWSRDLLLPGFQRPMVRGGCSLPVQLTHSPRVVGGQE